jgi:hypothetical protein
MFFIILLEAILWLQFCGLAIDDLQHHDFFYAFIAWCIGWLFFLMALGHTHLLIRGHHGRKQESDDDASIG